MRALFLKPPPALTEAQLEESIRQEVDQSQIAVLEHGMSPDMEALYMDQTRKIWAFMKDRYGTGYKMATDLLDWDELTDRIAALPGCNGDVHRCGRTFSARFTNRTWSLSWIGDGKYQIIKINPFGQLMPGMRPLCATYRIPEMIADTDEWMGKLDEIIREETMNIRQKIAQKRINTSTAKALLEGELGDLCKYRAKYMDDHVKVSIDLHQNRRVVLRFRYDEMYGKISLLGKTVRDLNSIIDAFGARVNIGYVGEGFNSIFSK